MDPLIVGILGIVVLLVLLASGVYIALSLAIVGFLGAALIVGFDPAGIFSVSFGYFRLGQAALLILPLFVFMGALSSVGGISRDTYTCVSMWAGKVRGALGISTVLSCAAFGVVTGSSVVTTVVFAKVSGPEMRLQGYDKRLAYGICASSGCIGMLIPPSAIIVVYSLLSEVSTGKLLIAAISPGIMLTVLFSVYILLIAYFHPSSVGGSTYVVKATWRQRFASLKLIWPIITCAAIVIGGIFGGVFTPNESAAWGSLVLIIVTVITGGRERWEKLIGATKETVPICGMVGFILLGAGLFSGFMSFSGMNGAILNLVISLGLSQLGFILVVCLIYLVMGCFLDSMSMLSITLPTLIPVVNRMGIDPIYFAMLVIMSIEIGLLTPHVGLNVFAAKGVAEPDVGLEDIFRGCLPFVGVMIATLTLMIAFPRLSTILPSLMFK